MAIEASEIEVYQLYKKSVRFDLVISFILLFSSFLISSWISAITDSELLFFLPVIVYLSFFLLSDKIYRNQSFGKKKYGIKIVTMDGKIPSLKQIVTRRLGESVTRMSHFSIEDYHQFNDTNITKITTNGNN
ncbi:RDD family protein [Mycoplasmatota bacterium WC30]